MNISKKLEKIGIIPLNELNIEERNYIAKNVASKLCDNINCLSDSYNEIYMRLFNCRMYYADIENKYGEVVYSYNDDTIYYSESLNVQDINEYVVHECIHYLQNFNKISNKVKRAGLCKFTDLKIMQLGINEAIVQYITAKAMNYNFKRINNDVVSIYTNSDVRYKYMTSLINQILFFIGEETAIKSSINSTEDFENELYNCFEENTEKIFNNFDFILEENDRIDKNEYKIIDVYIKTQELIYMTFFVKTYKRLATTKEIDECVQKLTDYEEIMGKGIGDNNKEYYDRFYDFKNDMESKFLKKYVEVSANKSNNSLRVIYKNAIYNIWNKILSFLQKKSITKKN